MADQRVITIDGVTLTVIVTRKAVKHINARLRATTLSVSAPYLVNDADLENAISTLARRLIRRIHKQQVNCEEDALALVQRVAARFPEPPLVAHAEFALTEGRWGSYSVATRTIRLHAVLRHMPRWVLEAVVAHEIAHAVHPNHSPAFWRLLRSVCPDTDRAQAFLEAVTWMARTWHNLSPVERTLLAGMCNETHEA
ncbi:MAG: M48 family metallopeptidase [Roseiflexus sp.]|nr:M48 family metallopeptidase [Roseiflexus sp.]MCS7287752.1 M48 family metallopeptidase [Roseiflexus sp.]MDW8147568.1 DUF45 domain-containing protein [Roseiflexaceae bacterium]MDW8233173.1 DUF45 domain-containing protein [Roseiflexaceae bacterium]